MKQDKIYIVFVCVIFFAVALVFDLLPRSTYSELEKRELAEFPQFSKEKLYSGEFTKSINTWFSDTEPYRESFMALSMWEKEQLKFSPFGDEETVTFHAAEPEEPISEADLENTERNGEKFENSAIANENAKIAHSGIIIVGTGKNTRALMAYGGEATGGVGFARAANEYKKTFGEKVNVYCMVVPLASEYYCPDKAKSRTKDQHATIKNIHAHLDANIHAVDAYGALARHVDEEIYLRTDHHWAPLGAFYAAEQFAKVAKVPFKPLSAYSRNVVHNFVGSMYGYSKDISIKNNPEDFIWYKPQGVTYTTTYIDYSTNKNYEVTAESRPHKGEYFYHFKDGNGGAYCTFMGGDMRITHVQTSVKNGRNLLVLKDSYGNAVPGYLFYSFENIYVVDFRYFTKNMVEYVNSNKVTDILMVNNIFNAYGNAGAKYIKFLKQKAGVMAKKDEPTDTAKNEEKQKENITKELETEPTETPEPAEEPEIPTEPTKQAEPADPPAKTEVPVAEPTE